MRRAGIIVLGLLLAQAISAQDPVEKTDEQILKEAGLPTEPAGLVKYLRGLPPTAEQTRRAAALVPQLGDRAFAKRDAAHDELEKLLPGAAIVLRTATRSGDPEIAERAQLLLRNQEKDGPLSHLRPAVRVLMKKPPAEACETLLAVLPLCGEDAAEEVFDALVRLVARGEKVPDAVTAALGETDPSRRSAAALLLGRGGTAEQRKTVQGLLADPNLEVRFRAALGLLAARDRTGLSVLVQVVREGTPTQARLANDLLTSLAAAGGVGSIELGTPAQRLALSRSWEAWVQNVGRGLDISRAEVEYGSLNRTLAALQMARQFATVSQTGNPALIKPLVQLPYAYMDQAIATTPQELENFLQNGWPVPGRAELLPTTKILALDAVSLRNGTAAKTVSQRHPRDEIVVVDTLWRVPNAPNGVRYQVFVRVPKAGGPARVVGFSYQNVNRVGSS